MNKMENSEQKLMATHDSKERDESLNSGVVNTSFIESTDDVLNDQNRPELNENNQADQPNNSGEDPNNKKDNDDTIGKESFVSDLVDERDQVFGSTLTYNKFKILLLKNFYSRKSKKLVTAVEFFIPILIFFYALYYNDQLSKNRKLNDDNENIKIINQTNHHNKSLSIRDNPFSFFLKIYYEFDPDNVNVDDLTRIFRDINLNYNVEFLPLPKEPIVDKSGYLIASFKKLSLESIDYEMKAVDEKFNSIYSDWFGPEIFAGQKMPKIWRLKRVDADIFHEMFLRYYLAFKASDSILNYRFYLSNIPLKLLQDDTSKKFDDNVINLFSNIFFIAFFFSSFTVYTSICDEKKKKLFDQLKLMGGTHSQILIGHFLNHFLVWYLPFNVCLAYYIGSYVKISLPFTLGFLFYIFGLLYLIHYLFFIILLTSPFTKPTYPQLIFVLTIIVSGSSFTLSADNNDVGSLSFITILHPLFMIKKFSLIGSKLSRNFNFTEGFFSIITHSPDGNEMPLIVLFFLTIFYIVLEYFLTIYILQVNPFQDSIAMPFNYFLKKEFWKPNQSNRLTVDDLPKQDDFEEVPSDKKASIIIKDLNKSYSSWLRCLGTKYQVLKSLSFAIYEREITVLLGHNGAGKSTTINMITGLSSADGGFISVQGYSVNGFTNEYKKSLGYCPQENIFFEELTVYQNLKIAAILKGVSFSSVDKKILNLAKQFDLQLKLGNQAKTLSGGMKRRLCLAVAIIGYNNVLVVDEPTSGIDAENRRKVWEILLELRKYKTILLTTHFLEEADILGDRIAIMNDGKIRCSGSSIYLKKLYNVGYSLRLELFKEHDVESLLNLIRQKIPDAIFENQQKNEYFFRLISHESDQNLNLSIADLFENSFEDEKLKTEFGIKAYGLTNTSLEDVFIKIGTLDKEKKRNENERQEEESSVIQISGLKEDHPLYNLQRVSGVKLYLLQFWAILIKKFKLTIKNLQVFISSLYPILMPAGILLFVIPPIITVVLTENNYTIETFKFDRNKEALLIKEFSDSYKKTNIFKGPVQQWLIEELGLTFQESEERDIKSAVEEEKKRIGLDAFKDKVLFAIDNNETKSYAFYYDPYQMPYSVIGSIDVFYKAIYRDLNPKSNLDINLKFSLEEKLSDSSAIFRVFNFFMFDLQLNMLVVIFVCMMFSYPFIAFIEHLNSEMNSGSLDMQTIAGLPRAIFWIGNLVFDFLYLVIVMFISCVLILIFDYENQVYSPHLFVLFFAFILTSLNCLLVTYFVINLNIKKEVTVMIVQYSLMLGGLIPSLYDVFYIGIRKLIANTIIGHKSDASVPLSFFLQILSPVYNLGTCFFKFNDQFSTKLCKNRKDDQFCYIIDTRDFNFGFNILAYFISIFLFSFLVFFTNEFQQFFRRFIENLNFSFLKTQVSEMPSRETADLNLNHLAEIVDENVEKEKESARAIIESKDLGENILAVHDLNKYFDGSFKAVDHLSFTVKREECFGLLGVNGAGKTTTFKMIGGSLIKTTGDILLDGYSFFANPHEYYRRLGFCPQENTHTNRISVIDNLKYFARINGIPSNLIDKTVRTLIEECNLEEHQNKFAEKLSGGNKRKLSTAIALIGKKDLILMDEPTTGVDPVAKRHLWKTFDFYKKELKTSFILTSHSMDEVEQLCNTIGIMVKGSFKVLGTFSYLRDKYSQGFTITIKIKDSNNNKDYIDQLKERMDRDFENNATMKEFYMNTICYIIGSKVYNWSHLFRKMEQIKFDLNLVDFLLEDTNLESIFLSFSEQPEIEN